jgi:hypothetical protein
LFGTAQPDGDKRKEARSRSLGTLVVDDLHGLHPDLATRLVIGPACLTAHKYVGSLNFRSDIWQPVGFRDARAAARCFLAAAASGNRDVLDGLIAAPFALAGHGVLSDRQVALDELARLKLEHGTTDLQVRSNVLDIWPGQLTDTVGPDFIAGCLSANGHDFKIVDVLPRAQPQRTYRVLLLQTSRGFFRVVGLLQH